MSGLGTSTTSQQQQSSTEPWKPAQPLLQNILGGIGGQFGNYQPTAAENGALNTLATNAQNTPNFTGQATGLANDLMSGGPDRSGILGNAYSQFQGAMSPYLNPAYLDPTKAPGMSDYINTIKQDVTNSVNGSFAAAGRDNSGYNAEALGRGITQGIAPVIMDQYNRNVAAQQGAAGSLLSGAAGTAQGMAGLDQQRFGNRAQGLDIGINGIPQAMNAGANNILAAAQARRGLPLQNLGMLENLTLPIAGLGSQSQGSSTSSYTMSPLQQIFGGMRIASGIPSTIGSFFRWGQG